MTTKNVEQPPRPNSLTLHAGRLTLDNFEMSEMRALKPRQRTVLRLRFGLAGRRHTYQEVGEKIGVGKERARQIQNQALSKMKHTRAREKKSGAALRFVRKGATA